jgi:hypothetical protein
MKLLVADGQRQVKAAARGSRSRSGDRRRAFANCAGSGRCTAGDTIGFASEVRSLRTSEKRPQWGIVQARNTGTNQHGELVYSLLATAFVPRRTAGT